LASEGELARLVKHWLMGTMQGSVSPEHVQANFDD